IKQTLYRTGPDSVLIDALVAAAQSGKEVTVVIELRARFDEEANIALANRLQEAGAVVVYGVVGYKTHAKMIQIVRREGGELRNYVHLGTGNYHAGTSRLYTDYGFMTCDPQTGEDVNNIFLQLTSLGRASKLKRLLQSPFTLQPGMLESINREASHAAEGRPARIIIKNNSLIDPSLIEALYRASQAGVQIDLIVRGMCLLRPGVPGISDNIRVRSILGRFLEHTRVYHFHNDGDPKVYLSSADWMGRNLYRRVEACFPVIRFAQKKRVVKELEKMLRDNTQAWQLTPAGEYLRIEAGEEEPFSVQQNLLAEFSGKP
ncbi:MAG: polyphosphate kinase 1, partial [Gammaproteobacteria bacterium]|nr:polyphosphate kinase 1 [Gammaproteobacteria bacterium]